MSEPTTHEVLVAARNLISDEKDWSCTGWGKGGQRCLLHALAEVTGDHQMSSYDLVRLPAYHLIQDRAGCYPGEFNDTRSHAQVLALVDECIAATAPRPDVSFLRDVRVEPETVA